MGGIKAEAKSPEAKGRGSLRTDAKGEGCKDGRRSGQNQELRSKGRGGLRTDAKGESREDERRVRSSPRALLVSSQTGL